VKKDCDVTAREKADGLWVRISERTVERIQGFEEYLKPRDLRMLQRPNELRRILYARRVESKNNGT